MSLPVLIPSRTITTAGFQSGGFTTTAAQHITLAIVTTWVAGLAITLFSEISFDGGTTWHPNVSVVISGPAPTSPITGNEVHLDAMVPAGRVRASVIPTQTCVVTVLGQIV